MEKAKVRALVLFQKVYFVCVASFAMHRFILHYYLRETHLVNLVMCLYVLGNWEFDIL